MMTLYTIGVAVLIAAIFALGMYMLITGRLPNEPRR